MSKVKEKIFTRIGDFRFEVFSNGAKQAIGCPVVFRFNTGLRTEHVIEAKDFVEAITVFNQLIHGQPVEIFTEEDRKVQFLDDYTDLCIRSGLALHASQPNECRASSDVVKMHVCLDPIVIPGG